MDPKTEKQPADRPIADSLDRREIVRKLGRFGAYAAPFTVFAITQKADAATGHGPQPLHR